MIGALVLFVAIAPTIEAQQLSAPSGSFSSSFANLTSTYFSPSRSDTYSSTSQSDDSASQTAPPLGTSLVNGDVSFKKLPYYILRDEKIVWLFPVDLAEGQHWLPTLAVVGTTAGLIEADPPTMRYFTNKSDQWNRFNENVNGTVTGALEGVIPASLYLFGLARHDSYAEVTAILAGEAYADSAIPHVAIKVVSRRFRPSAVPAGSDYSNTFFRSPTSPFGKGSSFPSGHAAAAFSIATVIARRYRDHRWVPWVSYGLAGFISFSRIPDRAHFPSDVFVGAVLGYTIARYDTLRTEP